MAHFFDDGLQDVDIKIQLVLPDGTHEMGYDEGGVELAHKKLVQEPAYIIEQWAKILSPEVLSLQDLTTAYEALQPTVSVVLTVSDTCSTEHKDQAERRRRKQKLQLEISGFMIRAEAAGGLYRAGLSVSSFSSRLAPCAQ
ncbi:unnamed protein product [Pleuronectes platessa]|uniref:Uncharacterized protein n=1 Tax=Pleuronectes platessa TaxID=8262 RepID=A0A9N7Y7G3_PLEPL|nr:unnamed protein product [Pleuronectes platessa]